MSNGKCKRKVRYINNDKIWLSFFFSSLHLVDSVEMRTSSAATLQPIILTSTEQSTGINGEDPVPNKTTTQPYGNMTINEQVHLTMKTIRDEGKALFTFHPKEWISAFKRNPKFPLFTLGDIDGFVALFMNNLATLLAVILGLRTVLEDDIIYGKIVPG